MLELRFGGVMGKMVLWGSIPHLPTVKTNKQMLNFPYMKKIDNFLNNITMYKLLVLALSVMAVISIILGFLGIIQFSGLVLLASLFIILIVSQLSNNLFARLFGAKPSVESAIISGYILFFLIEPNLSWSGILILIVASVLAMLSKYIFAIRKRHIFNPVAITAVILGLFGSGAIIWWIANPYLNIITLIFGLLIVRKIRKTKMVLAFMVSAIIVAIFTYVIPKNINPVDFVFEIIFSWQLIFFALIMFTEPFTSPPKLKNQIIYGLLVGILFSSQLSFGNFYMTPEMVLIIGNIFSYFVSSKDRLLLKYISRETTGKDIYNFNFSSNRKIEFYSGQFLEWTLPHKNPDFRGNRRYFTIASSPTENEIKLGVRIDSETSSSFKKKLLNLEKGETLSVGGLAGEFILPKDQNQKLVFIAGGIGITPFRSMIKYLIDKNEKRNIVLIYQANNEDSFAYKNLFDDFAEKIGLKIIYMVGNPSPNWQGRVGRLDENTIKEILPDFEERLFYISGANAMVESYKKMVKKLGVKQKMIKTDYFAGL